MDSGIDNDGSEQDELFEHHRFDVEKGHMMLRIDKFLMNRMANVSRNKIQHACEAGNILVNGKVGYNGSLRANLDSRGRIGLGGDINIRQNKINAFAISNLTLN